MIIDIGTGDGRAVLARAAADPRALVIGVDASAPGLAESSRRAARDRTRPESAIFLAAAAEELPGPLAGVADLVTVTMPWGSLLRGALGLDAPALRGIAAVVAPEGSVEVLVSVVPSDHVAGMAHLDQRAQAHLRAAWAAVGFELVAMRPATHEDLLAARSSWARRLGDRPVWRIELRRHREAETCSY